MRRFALFTAVAVLAALLTHLILRWFGAEDPGTIMLLIPIGIVFLLFYARPSAEQR